MKLALIIVPLMTVTSVFSQTPVAIERELEGHLSNIGKYGNYGGTRDEEKVDYENKQLKQKLLQYGKQLAVLQYGFPGLKGKLSISTSRDGKLRIYSWDEETGGTMHDHDSVFQFKGKSGKVHTWTTEPTDDVDIGAFFHQIFQVEAKTGPIYLAVSTIIGSTSLAGQTIRALTIKGEKLDTSTRVIRTGSGLHNSISFAYDFFSVVDRPERPIKLFEFDATKKSFRFPVVIEDEKTPQGRVTDKFITYQYNGNYFVKVS